MKNTKLLLMVIGLVLPSAVSADDWPQWRGPQRNGISRDTGLLNTWPSGGPKLLWQRTDVGGGYSTPSVVGDRIYLLANEGLDDEFVQARHVSDGSVVWSSRIGNVGNPDQRPSYPAARSTPTVDGNLLYALGSDGDLACLESATGAVVWQKNLRSEFGGRSGEWAYSESPLVDGDLVVCTPGGSEATLVALDKKTGEPIWKSAIPGGDEAAYASAIIVRLDGAKQYVQFLERGVVGVDAETGKFLWRYEGTAQGSPANIPTPVARDGFVYSATGRGGGGLVQLTVTASGIDVQSLYAGAKLPTSIGGSVLVGDHLFGTSGEGLLCVEFRSGEVKWQDRCVGPGSICYADGCLYVYGERTGEVALVEATGESYSELGRFTPPNQPDRGNSRAWAYPVVANGRLYLRDLGTLWCYDIQEAQ